MHIIAKSPIFGASRSFMTDLQHLASQILAQPAKVSTSEIGQVLNALRNAPAAEGNRELARQLHELIRSRSPKKAKNGIQKPVNQIITFYPFSKGNIAIGGKPGSQTLSLLQEEKCTLIVTLLKRGEKGVLEIQQIAQKLGIGWLHCPMSASELPVRPEKIATFRAAYAQMGAELAQGGKIFVHCAAGIHRTGAFTYGFLRSQGLSATDARALIGQLRPVTLKNAVDRHWQWAEQFATD